jgi:hypothetical protein
MKLLGSVIFVLILTGCASTHSVSFSPSQEYAVAVQSTWFDAVRTDNNDTTLFSEGQAIGFIRIEPIPSDFDSPKDFLETLRSASESDTVTTRPLNVSKGFNGFSAKNQNYLTGYLATDNKTDEILVLSFPEGKFEKIAETVSSGI